ncbi:hypothetical protein ACFQ0B_53940 [Nonomuraea thailandensis]
MVTAQPVAQRPAARTQAALSGEPAGARTAAPSSVPTVPTAHTS